MITAAWRWLVDPNNDAVISAIGFILGVIGFAITLGGLAVALRRLRKLETAAVAAQSAVENFRLRIVHYDAATDASEAHYALQTTRRHLNNDGWREAAESYEDARSAMMRVQPYLAQAERQLVEEVDKMIAQLNKHCTTIERGVGDPLRKMPDKASLSSSLRRHLDIVQRVQRHLEQRAS